MLFLIRATVVIGGLSYLALLQDRPDATPVLPEPVLAVPDLAAAWAAMPKGARDQIVQAGSDTVVRNLSAPSAPSGDTLAAADRKPSWRGVASHSGQALEARPRP